MSSSRMRAAWRSLLPRIATPVHISRQPRLRGSRTLSSLSDLLSQPIHHDRVRAELDSADPALDHDSLNSALRGLFPTPDLAQEVFRWAAAKDGKKLSSKSYNIMLGILGSGGRVQEFWDLVEITRKKGYGISKNTFLKVSETFENEGLAKDLDLLRELYLSHSLQSAAGKVCKILRQKDELDEEMRKELGDLGVKLSSDLVVAVLDRIGSSPEKGLVFLQWVEENKSFGIDGRVNNAMARVLGREDCIEEFRSVLDRMRDGGYEMEMETYVKVSERFYKKKMVAEAVDLYEFAMGGSEKPSNEDFLLLLRKIVVGKDLDLNLVSRTVSIFISAGNCVKGSVFDSIVKALRSVGRLGECVKVLKAMEDGGFIVDGAVHDRVVIGLCDARKLDGAFEYLDGIEKLGHNPGVKAWTSLVQKHSLSGELDKALSCFRRMVERRGGENVGCAFEMLVNSFCHQSRAGDAFKILKEMVTNMNLQPWHSTYKYLIKRLISRGSLKEASSLLGLMKGHGYPPYIDPFIGQVSKSGTADDAMTFLKAMTVKEYPSKAVFLRIFEELLRAGRHQVAHDLLSKSPGSVRNHADVLELFYAMRPDEAATAAAV